MDRFHTQGKRILDEYGRERIFNGMNVCDKGEWVEETCTRIYGKNWESFIADKLKTHGFNLIRLGITWDAVEPEPGKYDEEFLADVKKTLDECEKAGIYIYLDMHQDLYSAKGIGCGDGAPDWATDPGKYKFQKTKLVWAEGYFWGRAVHQAFDNFWDNKVVHGKGLQDWYCDMWKHVVKELGTHPAVIGYDVLNEPFPGKSGGKVFRKLIMNLVKTTITDKSISKKKLISAVLSEEKPRVLDQYIAPVFRKITSSADEIIRDFDLHKYFPFLSKTSSAIRQVDNDGFIFMENSYYSNLGIPYSCPKPVINAKTAENNVIFAPHAYDLMVDTPAYKYASNDRVGSIFAQHKASQDRLGIPVIVGEWGGYSEGNEWFPHVKFLLDLFDSYKWSNTYWAYFKELLDDNNELFNDVLTRPYPRAVTGEIESYCHNRDENTFTLKYTQNEEFSVPTEIFAHKPVKSVAVDGEYKIMPIENSDGSVVEITTGIGEHTVKIEF